MVNNMVDHGDATKIVDRLCAGERVSDLMNEYPDDLAMFAFDVGAIISEFKWKLKNLKEGEQYAPVG